MNMIYRTIGQNLCILTTDKNVQTTSNILAFREKSRENN